MTERKARSKAEADPPLGRPVSDEFFSGTSELFHVEQFGVEGLQEADSPKGTDRKKSKGGGKKRSVIWGG
jgi:hypothetical protein